MESRIPKLLGELDTLLAKSQKDRARVETARTDVDKIYSEIVSLSDDLKLWLEVGKEFKVPLRIVNRQIANTYNELASANSNKFQELPEGFFNTCTSLSKKLQETVEQLNAFISELEEKRERIEKAKTLKELEGISLGALVSIDSKLLSDADGIKRDWKKAGH